MVAFVLGELMPASCLYGELISISLNETEQRLTFNIINSMIINGSNIQHMCNISSIFEIVVMSYCTDSLTFELYFVPS